MASTLIQNQAHNLDALALYVRDASNLLVNAFKVEVQVFNESDALPGAQLFPAVGRLNVTLDAVGHFGTGLYGIPDGAVAWTPAVAVKRGRVDWYYTLADGGSEQLVQRSFEVLPNTVARRWHRGLALVQDVRDAGAAAATTDRTIHELLVRTRELFERFCRGQRFVPIRETRLLTGNGRRLLHLSEAIYALGTFIQDTTTLDNDTLRIWGRGIDRYNPRIEIISESESIYTVTGTDVFTNGFAEHATGIWGFIEPDTLDAPIEVKEAAIRFILRLLGEGSVAAGAAGVVRGTRIRRETTDRHSIEYADAVKAVAASLAALMRDQAVIDALRLYRAPLAMAVAA